MYETSATSVSMTYDFHFRRRYDDEEDAMTAPQLPEWCLGGLNHV